MSDGIEVPPAPPRFVNREAELAAAGEKPGAGGTAGTRIRGSLRVDDAPVKSRSYSPVLRPVLDRHTLMLLARRAASSD